MIQKYVKYMSLLIIIPCYSARTMQVGEVPRSLKKKSIFVPIENAGLLVVAKRQGVVKKKNVSKPKEAK
jgi:hypothetical protein